VHGFAILCGLLILRLVGNPGDESPAFRLGDQR
jgi:hypothetical protein